MGTALERRDGSTQKSLRRLRILISLKNELIIIKDIIDAEGRAVSCRSLKKKKR